MKKLLLSLLLFISVFSATSQTHYTKETTLSKTISGHFPEVKIVDGKYIIYFWNNEYSHISVGAFELFHSKKGLTNFADSVISISNKLSNIKVGEDKHVQSVINGKTYRFVISKREEMENPNYDKEREEYDKLPFSERMKVDFPRAYVKTPTLNILMMVKGGYTTFTEYGIREFRKVLN